MFVKWLPNESVNKRYVFPIAIVSYNFPMDNLIALNTDYDSH